MFISTENALRYGIKMRAEDKLRLINLKGAFSNACHAAIERKQYDLAVCLATQAQFCREALNAKSILYEMRRFL